MRRLLMIILPPLLAAAFAGTAFAQTITLAWDANTESNIAGYKVYYKTGATSTSYNGNDAAQGPSPVDVGPNLSVTLSGLDDTQPHAFVVTAYNSSGLESTFSAPFSSSAFNCAGSLVGGRQVWPAQTTAMALSAGRCGNDSLGGPARGRGGGLWGTRRRGRPRR